MQLQVIIAHKNECCLYLLAGDDSVPSPVLVHPPPVDRTTTNSYQNYVGSTSDLSDKMITATSSSSPVSVDNDDQQQKDDIPAEGDNSQESSNDADLPEDCLLQEADSRDMPETNCPYNHEDWAMSYVSEDNRAFL